MANSQAVDREALRQKYREERDKRLEVKDRANYIYLEGDLAARYDTDPWAPRERDRAPVRRSVEAVIIGGGFSGLLAGASLRKNGVAADDICIIDRAADLGGTWYWNRYPGLSCDTESYCYLPLLEETGYTPSEKYAKGPEIMAHAQRIGRCFGLYDQALLQTRVTGARWDDGETRWIVTTDHGDEVSARYLWLCAGYTNRPKLPGLPGLRDFKGHSFHTMRWDYDYTGGGPEGGLVKLKDKRVGLIGTGATAIQCVPALGEGAKELVVFQRTPSAVNIRNNKPTDPEWAAKLEPGWQRRRMENFLSIVSGIPQDEDLVDDAWTWNFKHVRRVFEADKALMQPRELVELADFHRMDEIRARVDEVVKDPSTAAALKAWYGLLCKRPTFHDEYLQTFNRPNVSIVDTDGRGVERITERGVVAGGREYELDCIIFATGFDTVSGLIKGVGFDPLGVGGVPLSRRWTEDFSTLHGMHVSQFPNMFIIGGVQGAQATTMTYTFEIEAEHCARLVRYCMDRQIARLEAKPEAEQAWKKMLAEAAVDHHDYYNSCTPGYINFEGNGGFVWDFFYGAGPIEFSRLISDWLDGDVARDLDLRPA
jgi:cyclohexanone monooxygenase